MKIGDAVALLRADISQLKKSTEEVKQNVSGMSRNTQGSMKDFAKGFISAQLVLEGMKTVVNGVKKAVDFAIDSFIELGKRSGQLQDVSVGFSRNFKDAEGALNDLRKASKGTISDFDLMLSANKASMLGVSTNSKQLAKLLEIARARGQQLGVDTTQAFSDIVTGIGRNSPLILDNLGITTAKYQEQLKQIQKNGKVLDANQQKQLLLATVLKDNVGSAVESNTANVARLSIFWTNLKDELAKKVAPVFEKVTSLLFDFANGFWEFLKTGDAGNDLFGKFWENLGLSNDQIRAIMQTMESYRTKAIEVFGQVAQFVQGNWRPLLIGALTAIGATLIGLIAVSWTFISPILSFIAVITALGILITRISKAWQDNFGGIRDKVFELRDSVIEFAEKIQKAFNDFMANPAVQWFITTLRDMFVKIIDNLRYAWESVKPPLEDFIKKLGELWVKIQPVIQVLGIVAGIIAGTVILVIVKLVQILSAVLAPALNVIIWVLGKLVDWINSALDGFKILKDGIIKIWNSITDFFENNKLGQAIIKPFKDAWNTISEIVEKIRVAMDKISPFHHESPSLIDKVTKGVGIIKDQFSDLGNISFSPISHSLAPSLAGAGTAGGDIVNVDLSGANISSPDIAEQYAEIIGDKILSKLAKNRRTYA